MQPIPAILTLSLMLILTPLSTFASGSGVRGGGKAVVCRNADQSVKSVEVLDLWEAETLYGRHIVKSSASVFDQVAAAINTFSTSAGSRFGDAEFNKLLKSGMAVVVNDTAALFFTNQAPDAPVSVQRLRNVTLALTDDSFEVAWPSNCQIEQVIDQKVSASSLILYVNQDLFDSMDTTNQAALILHESIYNLSLGKGVDQSSVRTRRAVGYVFSGGTFVMPAAVEDDHIDCVDSATSAAVVFSLFKDHTTQKVRATTFLGYSENPIGYFPTVPRFSAGQDLSLNQILSPKVQCSLKQDGKPFIIAIMGGAGPVDFDRGGALVGSCTKGSLTSYWIPDALIGLDNSQLTKVSCSYKKAP